MTTKSARMCPGRMFFMCILTLDSRFLLPIPHQARAADPIPLDYADCEEATVSGSIDTVTGVRSAM